MNVILAGIDYSYTCPAIAIYSGEHDKFSFEACRFFYMIDTAKYCGSFHNGIITGTKIPDYRCDEERYSNIADWAMDILENNHVDDVYIEGYAMGSKSGMIFNIAENAGLLKNRIWQEGWKLTTVPPTTIKKFATGKGNSDKIKMHEAFQTLTGVDLQGKLCPDKGKIGSPVGDVVDAFYVLKYGMDATIKNI